MGSGLGVGFTAGEGEVTATGEGGFVVSLLIEETGTNAARKNDRIKTGGVLTEIMDLGFWLLWGLVMIWVVLKVRLFFQGGWLEILGPLTAVFLMSRVDFPEKDPEISRSK